METNFSHVVDLLPGLVWTALPTAVPISSTNAGANSPASASTKPAVRIGKPRSTRTIGRACPRAGKPSWHPARRTGSPRLRRFDGEYRWFLLRTSPIVGAAGEVVGCCGVATDIEDRKRHEEASEARGLTDIDDRKWAETLLAGEKQLL